MFDMARYQHILSYPASFIAVGWMLADVHFTPYIILKSIYNTADTSN